MAVLHLGSRSAILVIPSFSLLCCILNQNQLLAHLHTLLQRSSLEKNMMASCACKMWRGEQRGAESREGSSDPATSRERKLISSGQQVFFLCSVKCTCTPFELAPELNLLTYSPKMGLACHIAKIHSKALFEKKCVGTETIH